MAVMEVAVPDDEGQVSEEVVQMWCVEEQAMETDIALLQQVEELEKKVTAASLQAKIGTNTHAQTRPYNVSDSDVMCTVCFQHIY